MRRFSFLPWRWTIGLAGLFLGGSGCNGPVGITPPPPAEKPKIESDLATTTLPAEAVRSLGIKSETVARKEVQDRLQLTGWVMARQRNEVTVTAPVAGYVRAASQADAKANFTPINGLPVQQGQELFSLVPVLSPVERIKMAAEKRTYENELQKAKESVAVAATELKRVDDLYRNGGLRTEQDVEQAKLKLRHAQQDETAAQDKLKLFAAGSGTDATVKTMSIRAPRSGTVLTVHVSPGQYVAAAAPLVTIVDLSSPWVRVPVPEHDLLRVDTRQRIVIALRHNGTNNGNSWLEGRPVAVVPQVDSARRTADLVYELTPLPRKLTASDAVSAVMPALVKDQMVTVYVPLGTKRKECVVPYAAVVFDAYGGAWVYVDKSGESSDKHLYE